MRPRLRRSIALLLAAAVPAHSSLGAVVEVNIRAAARLPSPPRLSQLVETVPAAMATVRESVAGRGPAVILIQDVHLNGEAQRHIAATLAALADAGLIDAVGVEGAFRAWNTRDYRDFPDQASLARVARAFLDRGELAAPSFVAMTRPAGVSFAGVDDRALHSENVQAYADARARQARVERALDAIEARVDDVRRRTLRPALRRWDDDRRAFGSRRLKLGAYARRLAVLTPLPPMLRRFSDAHELESRIDIDRVERERRIVVEKLAARLDRREMARFLSDSAAYRAGRLPFGAFYGRLKERCAAAGIEMSGAPEFERYLRYAELADEIRGEALFDELAATERRVARAHRPTADEWNALDASRRLQLLRRMVRFELTPADWEDLKQPAWAAASPDARRIERDLSALAPDLAPFERFYAAAERRSAVMVRRTLARPALRARAIVAGGFHAPQMARLLRRAGVPYAVVTPRLSRIEGDASAYLSAFSRERTPLDRLFSGDTLFVNPTTVNLEHPPIDRHVRAAATVIAARRLPERGRRRFAGFSAVAENVGGGVVRIRLPGMEELWAAPENPDPVRYRSVGDRDAAGLQYLIPTDRQASNRWLIRARRLFERVRQRLESLFGVGDWDQFMARLDAEQTPADRAAVEDALRALRAAGLKGAGMAGRILLIDELTERELEAEDLRIGGVLVRHRGRVKILMPRHRLLNPSRRDMSDLLHELVETELLDAGAAPDAAHAAALIVQDAFLRGPSAAAAAWDAVREQEIVRDEETGIPDGVVGAMHRAPHEEAPYQSMVRNLLSDAATRPIVWAQDPAVGTVVNVAALIARAPPSERSQLRKSLADALWDVYRRGFSNEATSRAETSQIPGLLEAPGTIVLGLFDVEGKVRGYVVLEDMNAQQATEQTEPQSGLLRKKMRTLVADSRNPVRGRGTLLLNGAIANLRALGVTRLFWVSAFKAAGFYHRFLQGYLYHTDQSLFEADLVTPVPLDVERAHRRLVEAIAAREKAVGAFFDDPPKGAYAVRILPNERILFDIMEDGSFVFSGDDAAMSQEKEAAIQEEMRAALTYSQGVSMRDMTTREREAELLFPRLESALAPPGALPPPFSTVLPAGHPPAAHRPVLLRAALGMTSGAVVRRDPELGTVIDGRYVLELLDRAGGDASRSFLLRMHRVYSEGFQLDRESDEDAVRAMRERLRKPGNRTLVLVDDGGELQGFTIYTDRPDGLRVDGQMILASESSLFRGRGRLLRHASLQDAASRGIVEFSISTEGMSAGFHHKALAGHYRYWMKNLYSFVVDPQSYGRLPEAERDAQLAFLSVLRRHEADVKRVFETLRGRFTIDTYTGTRFPIVLTDRYPAISSLLMSHVVYGPGTRVLDANGDPLLPSLGQRLAEAGLETGPPFTRVSGPLKPPSAHLSLFPASERYTRDWAWIESLGVAALVALSLAFVSLPASAVAVFFASLIATSIWLPLHALIDRLSGYDGERRWVGMIGGALALHALSFGAGLGAWAIFAAAGEAMPGAFSIAYAFSHAALHFSWNRIVPATWALSLSPGGTKAPEVSAELIGRVVGTTRNLAGATRDQVAALASHLIDRLLVYQLNDRVDALNVALLGGLIQRLRSSLRDETRVNATALIAVIADTLEIASQIVTSQAWLSKTMRITGLRQRGPWQGDEHRSLYDRAALDITWVEEQLARHLFAAPHAHVERNMASLIGNLVAEQAQWLGDSEENAYVSPGFPEAGKNALRAAAHNVGKLRYLMPESHDDALMMQVAASPRATLYLRRSDIGDLETLIRALTNLRTFMKADGPLRVVIFDEAPLTWPPLKPLHDILLYSAHEMAPLFPGVTGLGEMAILAAHNRGDDVNNRQNTLDFVRSLGGHITDGELQLVSHLLFGARDAHADASRTGSPELATSIEILLERYRNLPGRYLTLRRLLEALPASDMRTETLAGVNRAIETFKRFAQGDRSPQNERALRQAMEIYRTIARHVIFLTWRAMRTVDDAAAGALEQLDRRLTAMHAPPARDGVPAHGAIATASGMAAAKAAFYAVAQSVGNQPRFALGQNIYFEVLQLVGQMRHIFRFLFVRERHLRRDASTPFRTIISDDVDALFIDPIANNTRGSTERAQAVGGQDDAPVADLEHIFAQLARRGGDKPFFLILDTTFSGPGFDPMRYLSGRPWPRNLVLIALGSLQKKYQGGIETSTGGFINVYAADSAVRDAVLARLSFIREDLGLAPTLHQSLALQAVLSERPQVEARGAAIAQATERIATAVHAELARTGLAADVIHPSIPAHIDHDVWRRNGRPPMPLFFMRFAPAPGNGPGKSGNTRFLEFLHRRLAEAGLGGIEMRDSFGFNQLTATFIHARLPKECLRFALPPAGPRELAALEQAFVRAIQDMAAERAAAETKTLSLFPASSFYTRNLAWMESIGVAAGAALFLILFAAGAHPALAHAGTALATIIWMVLHAVIDRITGYEGRRDWIAMSSGGLLLHLIASAAGAAFVSDPLIFGLIFGAAHAAAHFGWNRVVPPAWALSMAPQEPGSAERRALLPLEDAAYLDVLNREIGADAFDDADGRRDIDEIIQRKMAEMGHDWSTLAAFDRPTQVFVRLRERIRFRLEGRQAWAPDRMDDPAPVPPPPPVRGAPAPDPNRASLLGGPDATPFDGAGFVTTAREDPLWKNADYALVDRDRGILIAADGVGSFPGADVASSEAARQIHATIALGLDAVSTPEQLEALIEQAFREARRRLLAQRADPATAGASTTIAVAVQWKGWVIGRKIGNSRIYRLRDGKLERLGGVTPGISVPVPGRDDSLVDQSVEMGSLTDDETYGAPLKNILTTSLAYWDGEFLETQKIRDRVREGDALIATTDGATDNLKHAELEDAMSSAATMAELTASVANAAMAVARRSRAEVPYRSVDDIAVAAMKARPEASRDAALRQAAEDVIGAVEAAVDDRPAAAANALEDDRLLDVESVTGPSSNRPAGMTAEDFYGDPRLEEMVLAGLRARGVPARITPDNAPLVRAVLLGAGFGAAPVADALRADLEAGKSPVFVLDRREPFGALRASLPAGPTTLVVRRQDLAYYRGLASAKVRVIAGSAAFFRGSRVRMEFLRGQLPDGANHDLENLVVIMREGTDVDFSGLSDDALRALRIALLTDIPGACRLMNGAGLKAFDAFARTILSQA